jgi:hypothetical protein
MASTNIQTFPGKVGVSNTNPVHTLDIGSNVYIDDTGANKLTVTGNIHASGITIDGDITVIDTQNLAVKDPVILLASESTGTTDTGIIMKRADGDSNVAVFYDEGVGLKICHTMSGADDTQLVADTSNALNTSIYGAVTIENTTSQALSVGGGAQIDGDFQVGEVANLFVDVSTSNVGIGTAVPAYELDVVGNVHADYFIGDGSAISAIQSSNVSDFASNVTRITNLESGDMIIDGEKTFSSNLEVGTANLFVDTTTGNVGVGTESPSGALDVVASSEGDYIARFKNSGTAGDEDARIVIEASDADGESQILLQTTNESTTHKWNIVAGSGITPSLDFQYNCDFNGGTRAVMIKHGGNVVVGGSTSDYSPFTTYGGALHDGGGIFSSKTCATLDVDRGGGSVPNDTGTGAILEFRHADDYRHVTIESVSEANYSEDIGLRFKTVDTSAGPEERMRITGDGNVGIGTASPRAALEVYGPIMSSTNSTLYSHNLYYDTQWKYAEAGYGGATMRMIDSEVQFWNAPNNNASANSAATVTQRVTITENGNVGIGTSSPNQQLQIYGNSSNYFSFSPAEADDTSIVDNTNFGATSFKKQMIMRLNNRNWYWGIVNDASNYLGLAADGGGGDDPDVQCVFENNGTVFTKYLRVKENVGIGTTDPKSTLDVRGPIVAPVVAYSSNQDSAYLIAASTNYTGASTNWGTLGFQHKIKVNSSGTPRVTIDTANAGESFTVVNSGNVGIGVTDPGVKLDLPAASGYNPVIRIGTNTTYDDGQLYSLRWGGSGLMGMGLYSSGRTVFGSQGIGLHIPNTEEYSVRTNGWAKLFALDGATYKAYFGGKVGIGVTNPIADLTVYGTGGYISGSTSRSHFTGSLDHLYRDSGTASGNINILARYWMSAYGFIAVNGVSSYSDKRIKKNIVDADDTECLEVLRLLKPKKYQYKDDVERGTEPVWGFIAQEVRETLPYATTLRKAVVPNIYELANVSQSNVITFTNFNTSNLESNATTIIQILGIDGKEHDINLVEVIDEHTIRVEEDLTEWIGSMDETGNVIAGGNQLFIYGQQVDDFCHLTKDAIWTVATSALQEVDRQLQAEKAKVATLETQLASVLARLDALENT